MRWVLFGLGIIAGFIAWRLAAIIQKNGYDALTARFQCGFSALFAFGLSFWVGYSIDEGLWRTGVLLVGSMVVFGAILEMLKGKPLAPRQKRS